MSDYKLLHRLIRGTAGLAVDSFFTELRVIGGENVPMEGPIIVYDFLLSLWSGAHKVTSQLRDAP